MLAGEAPPPFSLGDLRFVKLDNDHPPEGITLRDGVWPQVVAAIVEWLRAQAPGALARLAP